MRLRKAFLWSMIVSLSLAAALGVIAILFEDFWRRDEEALVTSLLVGAFSMICLACAFVLEKQRVRGLMWTGIACSLAALAVWLVLVWADPWRWGGAVEWDELLIKSGATFTVICLWSAHLGMMILLRLTASKPRLVRTLTLGLIAALGVTIIGMAWFEVYQEWIGKLIAVLSILGACGTVVTPILALIEFLARKGSAETIPAKVRLRLTCPRCQSQQQLRTGPAKCAQCGLRITIAVEEPRCACGYLLYRLESNRCPECGREIAEADRWAAT
ncbi:MAG: hypothetical protein O7F17_08690 [Planctomycetota bacterium]|nr:hypothetical protein [Planctomycetota bacterium]